MNIFLKYTYYFFFQSSLLLTNNPPKRDNITRPLNKLTSELIRTYKSINEVIFLFSILCCLFYSLQGFVWIILVKKRI